MGKRMGIWIMAVTIGCMVTACQKQKAETPKPNKNKLDISMNGPMNARNQDLSVILNLLQDQSGLLFLADEEAKIKVTFSLENPTVRTILDAILPVNGLAYALTDPDTVRIGRVEALAKAGLTPMPDTTPVPVSAVDTRFLDKRIEGPVMANNQDLKMILQLIQQEGKFQSILESGISTKVTFVLENPTIREVLDTALKGTGLEYVVAEGGVVRIQTKK